MWRRSSKFRISGSIPASDTMWEVDDLFAESVWTLMVESFGCSPDERKSFVLGWLAAKDSRHYTFDVTKSRDNVPMTFVVNKSNIRVEPKGKLSYACDDINMLLNAHFKNELRHL